MGFEDETDERKRKFADFQVDVAMMKLARSDALFMHCLPAHRGEEVAAKVIEHQERVKPRLQWRGQYARQLDAVAVRGRLAADDALDLA